MPLSERSQRIHHCVRAPMQMEDGQETRQRMVNDKLSVSELASTALSALPPVVALQALAEALRGSRYQTFPITPNTDAALQSGVRTGFCICIATLSEPKEPAMILDGLDAKTRVELALQGFPCESPVIQGQRTIFYGFWVPR